MPVQTHYVDVGRGAYKHAFGVLTSADLLVAGLIQSQDIENTRKLKYIFYDFTDVSDVQVGHEAINQLVEFNRKAASHSQGTLAAIAAPNPLIFGLARNWQTLAADIGWRAQIFHNRHGAIDWLLQQLALEKIPSSFLEEFPVDPSI